MRRQGLSVPLLVLATACAQPIAGSPLSPELTVALQRVDAGLRAYERGDRATTYRHIAAVWAECGPSRLARETLLIAIATELDPSNTSPSFSRAADLAAAALGRPADPTWQGHMAEALARWWKTFGAAGDIPVEAGEAGRSSEGGSGQDIPDVLRLTVLRSQGAPGKESCNLTAAQLERSPGRVVTGRLPAPALVGRIVELESDRQENLGRIRELEAEVERLRKLLKP